MSRVQQLEQQVRALNAQVSGGTGGMGQSTGSIAGPAAARLEVRLTQLEQELRAVTGRVEDLSYQVHQVNDRLDKLIADVDYRLAQKAPTVPPPEDETTPEGKPPAAPPRAPAPSAGVPQGGGLPHSLGTIPETEAKSDESPPAATPQASGGPPDASPRQQYAYAFSLLRKGKYDEAEGAFTDFLSRHPDDALADNARYWLGETYYARGNFARASETFVDGFQKNKTGPKAPDMLLKLGMSLSGLNKKKEACATYRELAKAFPDAPAAVKDRAAQESRKLGCS